VPSSACPWNPARNSRLKFLSRPKSPAHLNTRSRATEWF
jgi:hypothetical protein